MIRVSQHACQRYAERVHPCTVEQAHAEIIAHERAIHKAAAFGCSVVRCAEGHRLVLDGLAVVTVYARGNLPRQCRNPYRVGGEA